MTVLTSCRKQSTELHYKSVYCFLHNENVGLGLDHQILHIFSLLLPWQRCFMLIRLILGNPKIKLETNFQKNYFQLSDISKSIKSNSSTLRNVFVNMNLTEFSANVVKIETEHFFVLIFNTRKDFITAIKILLVIIYYY